MTVTARNEFKNDHEEVKGLPINTVAYFIENEMCMFVLVRII